MFDRLFSFLPLEGTPAQAWLDALQRFWSPYDINPLNINPLRDVIERFVDFEAVRKLESLQLFISATNVQTGRLRVFAREAISADVVMASACLPLLFHAVTINGIPYWDGGYMANPAIFPFFDSTQSEDVLIVQINPISAQHDAELLQRNHEPRQRDHLQLVATGGIPRHRFRDAADRREAPAARARQGRCTGASMCTASRSVTASRSYRWQQAQFRL